MRIYGDVAQMVERALRMREVKGSMPFFSIFIVFEYKKINQTFV